MTNKLEETPKKVIIVQYESTARKFLIEADPFMAMLAGPAGFSLTVAQDPQTAFTQAMTIAAKEYVRTGLTADFCIVDSADISDICFSNQNFFDNEFESALAKEGVVDRTVQGLMGGSYAAVLDRIKHEAHGRIRFLNDTSYAEKPVLYKITQQKKSGGN